MTGAGARPVNKSLQQTATPNGGSSSFSAAPA
jgi:hypothetical protein